MGGSRVKVGREGHQGNLALDASLSGRFERRGLEQLQSGAETSTWGKSWTSGAARAERSRSIASWSRGKRATLTLALGRG